MWNKLPNSDYFISFSNGSLVSVYLSDFISIWCKIFFKHEFATCLKESNRLLEIEEYALVSKAVDILQNVSTITKVSTKTEANGILALEITRLEGFPVKINIGLKEESKEKFFQYVTQPLLRTVDQLRLSEKELCQLLLRKDKEIKEYKEEGGKIALRHLKTPLFDDKAHMKAHTSQQTLRSLELPFALLYEIRPCKQENNIVAVKQENAAISVKEEPRVADIDTAAALVKQEMSESLKPEPSSQSVPSLQSSQSRVSPRKRKKIMNL